MRGRRDPRGPVDVDPDVVAVGDERLTRVEAHAHPKLAFGPVVGEEGLLGLLGGREPLGRIGEDDEEAVALRVDLDAAVSKEGRPKQPAMVGQHLRVPVAERTQQPSRPFDVGEEERDAARR